MSNFRQIVLDLVALNQEEMDSILNVNVTEQDFFIDLLTDLYKFTANIGMENQFKQSFVSVSYIVRHSDSLKNWINRNSRISLETKQAIMFLVLIFSASNKNINLEFVASLENAIKDKIPSERSIEVSLFFFISVLHVLFNSDKDFIFKIDNFDIGETLISENALSAALAMYRIGSIDDSINLQNSLSKVFQIFYIYYSDVHILLPYSNFLEIHYKSARNFKNDTRLLAFYFEVMTRTLDYLNKTNVLASDSIFRIKQIHPLLIFDDFSKIIQTFYNDMVTKTTDYIINLEQYAKDFKDILFYIWNEAVQMYKASEAFGFKEVAIEDISNFATQTLPLVTKIYFTYKIVPHTSLLSFLDPAKYQDLLNGLLNSSLNFAANASSGFLSFLNSDVLKNLANVGLGSLNLGQFLSSSIQRFLVLDFVRFSKLIQFFWGTYTSSSDFQKIAQKGDSQAILMGFMDYVKEPFTNVIRKGLDKIPFGSQINLSNISGGLDFILRNVKGLIAKDAATASSVFTSPSQMIADFSKNFSFNSNDAN